MMGQKSNANPQIFVSYSHSDRLAVDRLINDLRKSQYVVWYDWDERGIAPGKDWHQELLDQVSASGAVIACLSPDFIASPYCREEIEQAKRESKPIYPVVVRRLHESHFADDMALSYLQNVDLTQDYDKAIRQLRRILPRPLVSTAVLVQRLRLLLLGLAVTLGLLAITILGSLIVPGITAPTATMIPPTPTQYVKENLGIAVAKFSVTNVDLESADTLTANFSNLLDKELGSALSQHRITYGFLGPEIIGRISGEAAEQRTQQAMRIASDRGADKDTAFVVIYGTVAVNGQQELLIQPEFYISASSFANAFELTGYYRLGKAIVMTNNIDAQRQLSSRSQALTLIVEGLVKYVALDFQGALQVFKSARNIPDWSTIAGQDVLNILIGNANLRLAGQAALVCNDQTRTTILKYVEDAIQEYQAALNVANSPYSRPYSGLAAAHFLKAGWLPTENANCPENPKFDPTALRDGLRYVDQAKSFIGATSPAPIVQATLLLNEAHLSFAICTLVATENLSETEIAAGCKRFQASTDQLINIYQERRDPLVAPPAADAYGMRGDIQAVEKDYYSAIKEYDRALSIEGILPTQRMFFTGFKADCAYNLNQLETASALYETARNLAEKQGDFAREAFYKALRDEVNSKIKPNTG